MTQIPFRSNVPETTQNLSDSTEQPSDQFDKPIAPASQLPLIQNSWQAFRSSRSLRRQLLQTILPLVLAPLLVESTISYLITQNRSQNQVNKELQEQTLLVNQAVRQTVATQFNIASLLANNPLVLDMVRSGAKKTEANDLMLPRRTVNDIEDEFEKTKLLEPNETLNNYLERTAKAGNFGEVVVTEKHGLNVGYNKITSDFLQSDEEWWQQGKAQTQWLSNPTYDESTGYSLFGINLSQKIQDPDSNEFLGVIKIFVPAQKFGNLATSLELTGIRGSQEVQLLDVSLGSVLTSYSQEGEKFPNGPLERLNVIGGSLVAQIADRLLQVRQADQPVSPQALQQELRAKYPVQDLVVSQIDSTPEGESAVLVISFVAGGKQYAMSALPILDWVSIASMDTAEVQAESRGVLGTFILLALTLGGIAAIITVALSRQLSSPLNDLSAKARQVSAGNLDVTAEPRGSLETQTLAQTFNDLVFRVKGFLKEQNLNTRRASLAAEITGANVITAEGLFPVFDRVVEEARDILSADRVVIYQFQPGWSGTIAAESVGMNLPSALLEQISDPCIPQETRQKYAEEGILQVNNVHAAEFHPEHSELLHNLQVRSIVSVPMVSQGKLYGLVIAHHCRSTHQWQASEVDFLKQLGLQIGLVIERVQLLEQTQALAEEQRQIKEGLQRNALQLLIDVDPVSQGNLTVRAKVTEDEIGTVADSYNATIASLRKIVLQVQDAAQQVAQTTDTNEASVRSLSASAAQQAQEILTALERAQEMADSVRVVATNAEKAEVAVQQAAQTVQAGDAAMNRTVDGILAIRETVAETAKKVKRLGESSQKISNVVNLISGFAAQTNMLALNASIEASRAGEDGKGFAVVAEEVRGLARQSAEATTEIEKLVVSIQAETNEVVRAMEAGTEQVVVGTKLVDETRQSLNQITAVSHQISELVESIAQATIVQSQASETVTDVMTSVASIATQNSTAANQVSDSFEQLRSVAKALQEEIGRFKVG
ncbi:MAG TPA: methyl-accepting chemotaxis protein [Trichocoleus sp.]|jgi:methyl-accepting chemotaxis protein